MFRTVKYYRRSFDLIREQNLDIREEREYSLLENFFDRFEVDTALSGIH
jgi:hypothetical protein